MLIEFLIVCSVLKDKEVEIVFEFNGLGDWVVYDTGDSGFRLIDGEIWYSTDMGASFCHVRNINNLR